MPFENPQHFQNLLVTQLRQIYPVPTPIESEWRAIQNIRGVYSPRIDVVVGPFSTRRGGNCIEQYDNLMDLSNEFINNLLIMHQQNVNLYRPNDEQLNQLQYIPQFDELKQHNANARCLLAIEIENQVSRKHLLGGAVNAAALGRLGIVVGWTDNKVKALVRLQTYWDFLASVDKNTFSTANLLILSPQQLYDAINFRG